MIIDVHTHLVPESYLEFVEDSAAFDVHRSGPVGEEVTVVIGSLQYGLNRTFFDPERLTARMNAMGVDRAVLSLATPFVNYTAPASPALEAAQLYNEELSRLHRIHPDRFEGWAFLPMQDPGLAAKELRRAVRELGLVGGHISSNVAGRYLDQLEFSAVFETAVELDVPLFVHPSNPPGRERMADYELAVVAGYLFDTTLNIFNMIFGGLLDRYPSLRLCCTHLGGYAPMLRSRMQREVDTNRHLRERLAGTVGDYLSRLYYDTICFEEGYVRFASDEVVQPSHLLLGSDTPFPLGEPDPVGFVTRSFAGEAAKGEAILGENAARFLKLDRREDRQWKSEKSA